MLMWGMGKENGKEMCCGVERQQTVHKTSESTKQTHFGLNQNIMTRFKQSKNH